MKTQGKTHQELELLPNSPQLLSEIAARLHWLWRSLRGTTPAKLSQEMQVIHLENCWYHDRPVVAPSLAPLLWQTAREFLSRSRLANRNSSEPMLQRMVEDSGQVWWCASDPTTGQMTFLESEAEVDRWLEERFQG